MLSFFAFSWTVGTLAYLVISIYSIPLLYHWIPHM